MLTPVDPAIKEKIIAAYLVGFGRNRIDRELREQGIKVSHGSISNIIHAYKRHEQPSRRSQLPQPSPSSQSPPNNANISTGADMNNTDGSPLPSRIGLATIKRNSTPSSGTVSSSLKDREQPFNKSDRVTTFPEETLSEIEFKKNPDISIEDHAITNTQDFEKNGDPVDFKGQDQKGGPLSWFTNDYGSEIKSEDSQPQSKFEISVLTTQPQQLQQQKELVANLEDVLEPEDLSLEPEELKTVPEADRRTVPSIEDRLKQERDQQWQNYGPTWYSMINHMKKEKYQRRHEMLVIDRRKGKLEEWRIKLEQRESNLKDRETRVFEAEPFLSVAKQLQNLGIGMEEALPWIEILREKAEVENVDIRRTAINVAQELRLYRQSGGIQKQIERANQELALVNMATIQKQQTLTVLIDLLNRGVTESQIVQLINFAGEWNKYWQSSTTNGNGNLQQPVNGSNNPGSSDGNFSVNDLIRLNLLKSTITNMLNRMETSCSLQ